MIRSSACVQQESEVAVQRLNTPAQDRSSVSDRAEKQCARSTSQEKARYYGVGRQLKSTRTGISFLRGMVRSVGGSILKSVNFAGMVPVITVWFT